MSAYYSDTVMRLWSAVVVGVLARRELCHVKCELKQIINNNQQVPVVRHCY